MKYTKRILSILLAIAMMLGSLTAMFTVQVSAATTQNNKEEEVVDIEDYVTKTYKNPIEKLNTMMLMRTAGKYQLWADRKSGEIAWVETDAEGNPTENILFTNPYDVASSKGSASTKQEILSQIIVEYSDSTGTSKKLYSYNDAALNDQIKMQLIKGGVRVEYIIGREDGRKLIPRLILSDSFENNILANIQKAVDNGDLEPPTEENNMTGDYQWFINAWQKIDPNTMAPGMRMEMIKKYPVLGETYQDENGYLKYPILYQWLPGQSNMSDLLKREAWIKTYAPDYTFEQLDEDHEATGYVAEDEKYPVFKMALEYYLSEENGLTVRLPCNGLRYDASSYTLQNLTVLPYMGAGNYKNAGMTYDVIGEDGAPVTKNTQSYTFFPDGSGALFDHAELGNSTEKLLGYVYGEDYAYHQLIGLKFHKAVRYPVYGVVSNELFYEYTYTAPDEEGEMVTYTERVSNTVKTPDQIMQELEAKEAILQGTGKLEDSVVSYQRGYVAIVEAADSFTRLQLYHGGALHSYSTVFPYFNPKAGDTYNLSGSIASSAESIAINSDRKYSGSFTLRYVMLTDENHAEERKAANNGVYPCYKTSWLGMAEAYRDHLIRNGRLAAKLTENDVQADLPLYLEVFGALETKETIATIPVWVMTPLTTFENVMTMYDELSDLNVKNINFKLTGFANGGMYSTVPYKLKWEKNVGGEEGFEKLVAEAERINAEANGAHFGLYPDFDFAYAQNDTMFDGMNLKRDAVKTLDNRYTMYRYYDASIQNFVGLYKLAISPASYSRFYNKLLENYEGYKLASMSVASLGNTLNSDFDQDDPYNREQSKELTQEALSNIQSQGYSLMTDGGNAYTWAYVDHILNVELDSSRYLISSATVPFIGSVLHGYVQFAGAPLNEEGNVNYAMLRAIENGSTLYFILSYQNTTELKEDSFLSQYYSIRYDIWLKDVAKYYNELNSVLSDVQTKVIINHEFLVGERVLDLDELEADIANRLEDAMKEEDKIQQDHETSEMIAVADAWELLYHSEKTMKEMLDKVDAINQEIGTLYKEKLVDLKNYDENLEGTFRKFVEMVVANDGDTVYYDFWIGLTAAQFREMRSAAILFAQSSVDLMAIKDKAEGMIAEMEEAVELIRTTPLYDTATKEILLADMEKWMAQSITYVNSISEGAMLYFTKSGQDFLNEQSECYFMPDIIGSLEHTFVTEFEEGGKYYKQFFEMYEANIDMSVLEGEALDAAIKNMHDLYDNEIKYDLKSQCPLFTAEYIWAQIEQPEDEEKEEDGDKNSYMVNNNQIVVVTYGDRDDSTFEKTPFKSIILNYNSYAVRVTYNGVLYTVPSGGYVVINYN